LREGAQKGMIINMKRRLALALCIFLLSGVFFGCRKGNDNLLNFTTPKSGDTVATLETSMGNIKVMFFKEVAPKAVENFITHAKAGYYDNVTFHRVMEDFMIQGGDPQGTGMGGESIWGKPFGNETSDRARNFRGALAMANTGQPNSNGSQFFIVQAGTANINDSELARDEANTGVKMTQEVKDKYKKVGGYPSLDGGYTVFGQVIEGMDVVDKIAAVPTDKNDKPLTSVTIKKIDVETVK
jgi:peptidyl-prolyl cis-trans isomerase B (cyclophilin B)